MIALFMLAAATASWAPSGITATAGALQPVLAKMRDENRDAGQFRGQRVDRYLLADGARTIDVEALVRGNDYVLTAEPEGLLPQLGRANGERWRKSTSGTVHRIRADVQGDDYDRWPVTELGFDAADCTLAGVATIAANGASVSSRTWVLADRPALDIPRWLYVDQQTGDIVREISREGNRVETFDFGDVRGEAGARRPYAYRITGPGGQVSVALTDAAVSVVTPGEVTVPLQGPSAFDEPATATQLHASIDNYARIKIGVRVNGERREFQLDSGTPELILSAIPRSVPPVVLEHGVAQTLDVDGLHAKDAAFLSVAFWEDGLLGYEFFRGRIVHVDFIKRRLEIVPRGSFVAPDDAVPLPVDWSEGIPIATATIGQAAGSRFVLDLGSRKLYLSRTFVNRAGGTAGLDVRSAVPGRTTYLEGGIDILDRVIAPALFIGGVKFEDAPAEVEVADRDNLVLPLDGIIGTDELAKCEWWFDADGPISWFRPGR